MKKIKIKAEMLIPVLMALGVLLAVIGVLEPWFSVKTSPELEFMTNSTLSMDVNLFQTVTVTRTDENVTNMLTFSLNNGTALGSGIFRTITGTRIDTNKTRMSPDLNITDTVNTTIALTITDIGQYQGRVVQTDDKVTTSASSGGTSSTVATTPFDRNFTASIRQRSGFTSILSMATALTAAGLALSTLALALLLMASKTKIALGRYAYIFGILGALLLFIAPLITASNVESFWGSLQMPTRAFLWNDDALITWGASIGWYLTFAASMIIFACSFIYRTEYLDKKRILAAQSLK